jgi:hypothetical protein
MAVVVGLLLLLVLLEVQGRLPELEILPLQEQQDLQELQLYLQMQADLQEMEQIVH